MFAAMSHSKELLASVVGTMVGIDSLRDNTMISNRDAIPLPRQQRQQQPQNRSLAQL
jgi:hypothetical protein